MTPTVVFVPPSCCGAGYFRRLRRALGDRVDFRAVELPGHGRRFAEPFRTRADDVVRDIAGRLNADERITAYVVEAENFESIHNHSAYAQIERDKEHAS